MEKNSIHIQRPSSFGVRTTQPRRTSSGVVAPTPTSFTEYAQNNNYLWKLDSIHKRGFGHWRLQDISVDIKPGITAIMGNSGAGKSSLLNLLINFEKADQGSIQSVIQQNEFTMPFYWVPQNGGLWPQYTVSEHLEIAMKKRDQSQINELLEAFGIAHKKDSLPDRLSLGEQSRTALARGLASNAAVLVMDEPLVNIDPTGKERFWNYIIKTVKNKGTSLVYSTHNPNHVLGTAEQVIYIKNSRILYQGNVDMLYWQPASLELAECFGETNWFEPEDAEFWLNVKTDKAISLRPEQLVINKASESMFVVVESIFRGTFADIELLDKERQLKRNFFHRPKSDDLKEGDCIEFSFQKHQNSNVSDTSEK